MALCVRNFCSTVLRAHAMAQVNTFHTSSENCRNAEEATENAVSSDVLRRKLSNKLGRILWVMKLIGAYYGDTALNERPRESSNCCSRFYCMVVLLGQWFLVFVILTAFIFGGSRQISSIFWLMIGGIWCLQNAIVTALALYSFPKRRNKSSRFHNFISSLLSNSTADGLERVKTKTVMKPLALGCFISTVNGVSIVLLDLNQEYSITRYQPWNGNIVCHLFIAIFGTVNSFTWTVPFCLFCVSCALLEGMFDSLLKKVPMARDSHHILSIASLRKEHQKLCETVAMANKAFSPFLLVEISLDIPLLCIDFNELVQLPRLREENLVYVIAVLYWCTVVTGRLVVVLWFAMGVNEKIHSFYDALQTISVLDSKEHMELLQFLAHLRGDPIGMSIGLWVVINKSLVLSLVGIVISYFTVLMTLPSQILENP